MSKRQTQLATTLASEERKLLACVHCGLCLEACPTYVQTGDENDGPRGRLYLMRAVEEGRLSLGSDAFRTHINRCLGCRACESACPAGVEYEQLLEAARADIGSSEPARGFTTRVLKLVLRHVWTHPKRLRLAFWFARVARDLGLARLALGKGLSKVLPHKVTFAAALLDSSSPSNLVAGRSEQHDSPAFRASTPSDRGSSAAQNRDMLLFTGCVTEGLFRRVNQATARVLAVNGYAPDAPTTQVCCGALHAHAGELDGARKLARQNIDAFGDTDIPIVTNAGGCGAMLASYSHLLSHEDEFAERARRFSARIVDVSQVLAASGPVKAGSSSSDGAATKVTYDASCHLLHGQRAATEPLRVLGAVADVQLAPLVGSDVCCGGAGVYNLVEPELSSRVLGEKLKNIKATGAAILATGNPGCHMQISAGARLSGLNLIVCHPVELLDESYRRNGVYEDR